MRKAQPPERDLQRIHRREIRLALHSRPVHLREKHFPLRTVQAPPHPHPPLQCPQLPRLKASRIPPLQLLKDRQRFQPRSFSSFKYFRAVFSSIPAFAATVPSAIPSFDSFISLLTWWSVVINGPPFWSPLSLRHPSKVGKCNYR